MENGGAIRGTTFNRRIRNFRESIKTICSHLGHIIIMVIKIFALFLVVDFGVELLRDQWIQYQRAALINKYPQAQSIKLPITWCGTGRYNEDDSGAGGSGQK